MAFQLGGGGPPLATPMLKTDPLKILSASLHSSYLAGKRTMQSDKIIDGIHIYAICSSFDASLHGRSEFLPKVMITQCQNGNRAGILQPFDY